MVHCQKRLVEIVVVLFLVVSQHLENVKSILYDDDVGICELLFADRAGEELALRAGVLGEVQRPELVELQVLAEFSAAGDFDYIHVVERRKAKSQGDFLELLSDVLGFDCLPLLLFGRLLDQISKVVEVVVFAGSTQQIDGAQSWIEYKVPAFRVERRGGRVEDKVLNEFVILLFVLVVLVSDGNLVTP